MRHAGVPGNPAGHPEGVWVRRQRNRPLPSPDSQWLSARTQAGTEPWPCSTAWGRWPTARPECSWPMSARWDGPVAGLPESWPDRWSPVPRRRSWPWNGAGTAGPPEGWMGRCGRCLRYVADSAGGGPAGRSVRLYFAGGPVWSIRSPKPRLHDGGAGRCQRRRRGVQIWPREARAQLPVQCQRVRPTSRRKPGDWAIYRRIWTAGTPLPCTVPHAGHVGGSTSPRVRDPHGFTTCL